MQKPDKAFILAAGKGTRMKPLTDTLPKPMIPLAGRTLIDRTIDAMIKQGVRQIVVNLHYFGNKLEEHLITRKDATIVFSKEPALLDTGGGVKKAARVLGDDPFYVVSGDGFWIDPEDGQGALQKLAGAWDGEKMDILLLLQPVSAMTLTQGVGDYDLDPDGRAIRSLQQTGKYMFTSMRIIVPQIFRGTAEGAFSFLTLMDAAQEKGRLYGVVHDGMWEHISTPEDVAALEGFLSSVKSG